MNHLIVDFKIAKAVATDAQAYYWADILAPNSDYFVSDSLFEDLRVFTDNELRKITLNHNPDFVNVDKWDRETLEGAVLNIANSLQEDSTDIPALHGKLGRKYHIPEITPVSSAQRLNELGDKTAAGKGSARVQSSTVAKRPKPGTTTARVWDVADSVFEGYSDVTDKTFRNIVVEQCVSEGINISTARTQFGHWKRDKLAD